MILVIKNAKRTFCWSRVVLEQALALGGDGPPLDLEAVRGEVVLSDVCTRAGRNVSIASRRRRRRAKDGLTIGPGTKKPKRKKTESAFLSRETSAREVVREREEVSP
jgi:hypothetical protein